MPKRYWPISYGNLLCKVGQDFFDIQLSTEISRGKFIFPVKILTVYFMVFLNKTKSTFRLCLPISFQLIVRQFSFQRTRIITYRRIQKLFVLSRFWQDMFECFRNYSAFRERLFSQISIMWYIRESSFRLFSRLSCNIKSIWKKTHYFQFVKYMKFSLSRPFLETWWMQTSSPSQTHF